MSIKDTLKKDEYYEENGYIVFTEVYHLNRGHCCESDCRHCPYGYNKPKTKNKGVIKRRI